MEALGRTKYALLRLVHYFLKSRFFSGVLFWIYINNTTCISCTNATVVGSVWVVEEELRRFPTLEIGRQLVNNQRKDGHMRKLEMQKIKECVVLHHRRHAARRGPDRRSRRPFEGV